MIVTLLVLTAFVAVLPVGLSNSIINYGPVQTNDAFNGTVTINADGSLNTASAPITQNGNYYNLTGDINGSLIILHNGTIFNGQGHTIFYNSASVESNMIYITNTNSVSILNLNINSSAAFTGIYIENSSNDLLSNLVVDSSGMSLYAGNYTSHIQVYNSVFNNYPNGLAPGSVLLGIYFAASFFGLPSPTSSNFTVKNVTFSDRGGFADLMVGGGNSTISHSNFNDSGVESSVIAGGNYTSFNDNSFRDYGTLGSLIASPAFSGILHNVSIEGNTMISNGTPSGYLGIGSAGSGVISGNDVSINTSQSAVTGIDLRGQNTTVDGNRVVITNGGPSTNQLTGILTLGGNYSVSQNVINISGGSAIALGAGSNSATVNYFTATENTVYVTAGSAIGISAASSEVENALISNNVLHLNATLCQGIQFTGINDIVSGNQLFINQTDTTGSDISVGIGYGYSGTFINTSILNNYVKIAGSAGALQVKAIELQSSNSNNATVSGNSIDILQEATQAYAISVNGMSYLTVAMNNIALNGGFQALFMGEISHGDLEGNTVTGSQGAGFSNIGAEVSSSSNVSVLNNTFSNFNYAFSTNLVTGLVVEGNYVQNVSAYVLTSDSDTNMIFYHNNFLKYSGTVQLTGTESNITFNTSLPLGGNYWAQYTGTDGNGDGIGDTPYSLGAGYSDNLPLMKQWTRPQAVFTESGLLSGASWSVTFNGQTKVSSGSTISFAIVNGTYQNYTYNVGEVTGYSGGGFSGAYDYTGNGTSANVTFVPFYTLNFTETDLPAGTEWFVDFNGKSYSTANSSLSIVVLNGTYANYTINGTFLYYPSVSSGNISSVNANQTISITFIHWAYLNVTILPANATVILNGVVQNGLAGISSNMTIKAGSYQLVVKESGYNTYYENFTVSPNQTEHISVDLSKTGSGGLPVQDYYFIGGGIAVVAVASVVLLQIRKRSKP